MHIRDATPDDGAAIGELMTELGYPTSAGAMRDRLIVLVRDSSYVTLVTALERWAASRGARDIIVNSAFHRTRAHAFYERLGYAGTGVRMVKTLA